MKLSRKLAQNLSELLTMACKEQRGLISLVTDPETLMNMQNKLNDGFYFIGELENGLKDTTKTEIII